MQACKQGLREIFHGFNAGVRGAKKSGVSLSLPPPPSLSLWTWSSERDGGTGCRLARGTLTYSVMAPSRLKMPSAARCVSVSVCVRARARARACEWCVWFVACAFGVCQLRGLCGPCV